MSWQDWTEASLPPPLPRAGTNAEACARLEEFGYVILDSHLSGEALDGLLNRLEGQAAAEVALGRALLHDPTSMELVKSQAEWTSKENTPHLGREQFVVNLLNKGKEFCSPLLDERIASLIQFVLGSEYRLFSWIGSILHPGAPVMGLHTDQWFMPPPVPRGSSGERSGDVNRDKARPKLSNDPLERINPAYAVQTIWMLTDFTKEDGATRLVPKSHLSGVVPESQTPHPYETIAATGRAGSVLVYDARLWHSSGAHSGRTLRYALHGTFSAPQIRSQENFALSLLPEIRRELPDRLLDLLGFKPWWSIGFVDDFRAKSIDLDRNRMGRLELVQDQKR